MLRIDPLKVDFVVVLVFFSSKLVRDGVLDILDQVLLELQGGVLHHIQDEVMGRVIVLLSLVFVFLCRLPNDDRLRFDIGLPNDDRLRFDIGQERSKILVSKICRYANR